MNAQSGRDAAPSKSDADLKVLSELLRALRTRSVPMDDAALGGHAEALGVALHAVGSIWRISPDGGRMRIANGVWTELGGPVSEVAAARRPIEMVLVDDETDQPITVAAHEIGDAHSNFGRRRFGRYVPLFAGDRLVGVFGLERPAGAPAFRPNECLVHDTIAARIEDELADESVRTQRSGPPGVVAAAGVLVGDALLRKTGDIVFRYRFGVGVDFVSPTVEQLGWSVEEVEEDPGLLRRCVHPADRHLLRDVSSPATVRLLRRDGQLVWHFVRMGAIRDGAGGVIGIEGLSTDISELELRAAALAQQARTDPLTKLANRLTFHAFATRSLTRLARHPGMVGVLYLDLDGFKKINDTLGHDAGDRVLAEVAERLTRATRKEDVVARLGGDEFAVLLVELSNANEATVSAQRILDALSEPFLVEGREAEVSTGIGIAVTSSAAVLPDELVRRADTALYQAKRSGRGRWQVFGGIGSVPSPGEPVKPVADLGDLLDEGSLRSALVSGQFRVHYLPEIDSDTGVVTSVEALARWAHPTLGLLPASAFIDRADHFEIIHTLGDWLLNEACRQLVTWRARFGLALFLRINASTRQLARHGFADSVLRILSDGPISPDQLGIDVTERTLEAITPEIDENVRRLSGAGVRITIDDFGTGSATLRALRTYPLAQLKLDRSLIDRLDRDGTDTSEEIVTLAINLAGSLGAEVVAEGVERIEQLERLRLLQCHRFQGFLASAAQSAEVVTDLLERGQFAYALS